MTWWQDLIVILSGSFGGSAAARLFDTWNQRRKGIWR